MINRTLCFLVKKDSSGNITQVCLGMKMIGFGQGLWAGIGGKIKSGETVEEAVIRETEEEIGVKVKDIHQVAQMDFQFSHKPDWSQYVFVYMTDKWEGKIVESEEMRPQWFDLSEIPYDSMWEDAQHWLSQVLAGHKIKGTFIYGKDDHISQMDIKPLSLN